MQPSLTERQVEQHLLDERIRFTRGRRAVVRALTGAEGPMSAAELHEALHRNVPLSSLYRSLNVLEEAGVLAPHHSTRGLIRYELAEWLTGHHHHLVCVDCGAVDDIRLTGDQEGALEALVGQVTAAAGFQGSGHVLEIDGRCPRCA